MLHLELYRPERKGRYVKDDTAITRPDNRHPERERTDGADRKIRKKFEKVLTHIISVIY